MCSLLGLLTPYVQCLLLHIAYSMYMFVCYMLYILRDKYLITINGESYNDLY